MPKRSKLLRKSRIHRHRRVGLSRRGFKLRLKRGTLQSIAALIVLSASAVVAMSFTGRTSMLSALNQTLRGYLGWTTIFVPFLTLVIGLVLANYSLPITRPHVLIGTILLSISLSGLSRAGSVGLEIWEGLAGLVTAPGAMLMLLSSAIIGVLVLLSLSLDQVVLAVAKVLGQIRKTLMLSMSMPSLPEKSAPAKEMAIKGGSLDDRQQMTAAAPTAANAAPAANPPLPATSANPDQLPINQVPASANQIWELPSLSLLDERVSGKADRGDVKKNAAIIERTLESFNVSAKVVEVNLGPAVTQYALEVALGTKLSKILGLGSDLAMALAARTGQIRIEAPIPGRALVGIELPNYSPEFVGLKQMLQADEMRNNQSKLAVALGLDVAGTAKMLNLSKMPHMLIAGATGSGKSVCINVFIASILFRASPTEVKFIMVDPKRVELTRYNNIPHLLTPVIVEPQKVLSALKWSTEEMDRRYKLFAQIGARNLDSYNELSGFQALPYIVIIIDELADIMLFAPSEVEDVICRLAQMARATGIHLVIATQRPSVDILTGLIKANIPARISFAVSSMTDSRVVLDTPGAEKLLGQGDMLFLPPDQAKPSRIQGALISDTEVRRLIEFIQSQGISAEYTEEITTVPTGKIKSGTGRGAGELASEDRDDLFDQALRLVASEAASASLLQRKLSIGYARAARILDQMQQAGLVGPADGAKPREVYMSAISEFIANKSSSAG